MKRHMLILLIMLAFAPTVAHASPLTLASSKQVYQYGDTVNIVANVTNSGGEPLMVYVEHSLRDLQGRFSTARLLTVVELGAGEAKIVELYDLEVDDSFYSGQYVVSASAVINRVRVGGAELWFTVEGAPEDMEARLLMSQDPDYVGTGHVFIMGEKVYVKLTGAPQGAAVSAKLKLPDNSTQQLTLPAALTAKQVGAYEVTANVSASGYRDAQLRDSFTVLGESPQSLSDRKADSSLSLTVEKPEYTMGDEVAVEGEVSPPHSGAQVTLSYSLGGSLETARTVTTDDDGLYRDTYEPAKDGEWSVAASWAGDSNHLGAESQQVAFSVEAPPMNWLPVVLVAAVVLVVVALFLRRRR